MLYKANELISVQSNIVFKDFISQIKSDGIILAILM